MPDYQRREHPLPDGDFLDLDCLYQKSCRKKFAILIHGLGGSSSSKYICGLAHELFFAGYNIIALNQRGCSGRPNRIARTYHSGLTIDIQSVFTTLLSNYPECKLYAAGFSLGASQLLKWLGENHAEVSLEAAVAISPPFSLDSAARHLNIGFSILYRNFMISGLKKAILKQRKLFGSDIDWQRLKKARDFWTFDDTVTGPVNGFDGADDYYEKSSCGQFLKWIQTSTLIIHAKDDPFMGTTSLPLLTSITDSVRLELHTHGGHVGFVGNKIAGKQRYYLEPTIINYFDNPHPK